MGGGGGTSTLEFDGAASSTTVSVASSASSGARDVFLMLMSDSGDIGVGGNLNCRSMVPCLACGGPRFFVDFICDTVSCDWSSSPLSSDVGPKVLRTAFDGDSELAGDVGPGDVGVRDGAGIEARFAALAAWAL
jgi:hypothetical protein